MKRNAFIITGIILVIVLLAIWVYILFFNNPKPDNQFTDLNIGDNPELPLPDNQNNTEEPMLNVTSEKQLIRLTTKPTAGYTELSTSSTSPKVLYIESGTGHIYSIDLTTGEEKQLTNTTVSFAKRGVITPDGKFTMIQHGSGNKTQTLVGKINQDTSTLTTETLPETALSFKASDNNTLLYTVREGNIVIGKEYLPTTNTTKKLFTIPFAEVTIDWGNTADSVHYVYPKASSRLEGYLYKISQGKLSRLPISGFGLTAIGNDNFITYNTRSEDLYHTNIYNKEVNMSQPLNFTVLPEKCTSSRQKDMIFVCGAIGQALESSNPDSWYQGVTSYADSLWQLDLDLLIIKPINFISDESGLEIDTTNLSLNQAEDRLYFLNKNDQTLWLYKRLVTNWD